MNKIHQRLFLVWAVGICFVPAKAQVLEKIQQQLQRHQQTFQEKIFVHTDKETYLAGELLWFNVYNLNAATHQLSGLSKVAYVEIVDANLRAVAQTKVELKEGKGQGSLLVPSTVSNNTYRLRVYTNWMKNFGEAHLFEKSIQLINTLNSPEPVVVTKAATQLEFFPEGGDLVEGVPNTVAFKVTGTDGRGMDLSGVIVNQKNDTLARFSTLKFGLGKFSFTPQPNQSYKAIAGTAKKEILIKDLPVAKKQGYAMTLSANGSELSIDVHSRDNAPAVYLVAHNEAKTSMAQAGQLTNGKVSFQLSADKLDDGITLFTLFNLQGKPVSERLYFKRPAKQLTISGGAEFSIYDQRKPVNVDLTVKNERGTVTPSALSVSIRRIDSIQGMDHDDILSYLWLGSALKGAIESPSYYFQQNNQETNQALDHLLMTQGWRRFNWADVAARNYNALSFLPELNGHLISGELRHENNNAKINANVYLGVPGKRLQFYAALTDTLGRFTFNTRDFYGMNEIVVQTDTKVDTTSKIILKSPFIESAGRFTTRPVAFGPTALKDLQRYNLSMQVQNVYTAAQINRYKALTIDSSVFYGKPYKTYLLDDYTRFEQMEDVLREYVTETFVSKGQKDYRIKLLGKNDELAEGPLVLVDGVPYFNMSRVIEIDPKKIKSLGVLNDLYYYGPAIFEGILHFSSYTPKLGTLALNPNAVVLDYEGMQSQREFYQPRYENDALEKSRMPDFRNVLYWQADLRVNAEGKAGFSFYTSDLPGNYIGVVNGLSAGGAAGSRTFSFTVKEKN